MPELKMAAVAGHDMAAEVPPVLKVGPDEVSGVRSVASTVDHFRIVDTGDGGAATMVLYRVGAHIPPEHRGLNAVLAVFDEDDAAWVPDTTPAAAPVETSTVDSGPKRGRR